MAFLRSGDPGGPKQVGGKLRLLKLKHKTKKVSIGKLKLGLI